MGILVVRDAIVRTNLSNLFVASDAITRQQDNLGPGPTADAGEDRVVLGNANVILDGSGSTDPDGIIIDYLWTQLSGTAVIINNFDQDIAGFSAPVVAGDLVFNLRVIDNNLQVSNDQVTITVELVTDFIPKQNFKSEANNFSGQSNASGTVTLKSRVKDIVND